VTKKILQDILIKEEEIQGIKVKMPNFNVTQLKAYIPFFQGASYKKKLNFLFKTMYNTKQIKKSLDMRKYIENERNGRLRKWKTQSDKVLKQKINIRRLKLRVMKKLKKQKMIQEGKLENTIECPVYKCGAKF